MNTVYACVKYYYKFMISHSFTTHLFHKPRKIYSLFKIEYTCFSVYILSDHEILFQNITKISVWQTCTQNYNGFPYS